MKGFQCGDGLARGSAVGWQQLGQESHSIRLWGGQYNNNLPKKTCPDFPKVQKGVPFSRDFQKDPENGPSNDLNAPKVGDILSFFGAFFDFFFILHSFHVYGGGSSNLGISENIGRG